MLSVQTNVTSLIAQNNLRIDTNFQSQTIQELTSGYRINSSGDDPAGLAIANGYRDQEAQLTQGIQNANNGISTLQIVDGGMNNIGQILDRLQTLATESASGTFTGNRGVLNSEFQGLITEVNRQAQSIGLNQNGSLAKDLSVYIGGGQGSTSSAAAQNSTVQIDLTGATVDAKSLGLTGMQALGGTAGTTDIGDSSNTSVSKILAANTTPVADQTTFYMSGPGFSGASKVAVNVNTSSVSDVSSLVTAINDAIQNAGNEATPAASAFQAANIQASVNTDSSGKEQLAFTSSTTAFQVQAGDSVSNALMGNFAVANQPAAAAMGSTYTGGVTAAAANQIANPGTIKVQISGASMSSPVTLQLSGSDDTVGAAISDLQTQVAASSALAGAGVTLSNAGSASPLVFHSASGEQLQVMVTGDTANALGMGSFVAGAGDSVDYDTINGAAYSQSQNYGSATLQFSINGQASNANAVTVNMAGGDAQAAAITSGDSTAGPVAITANNNTLNLVVNGTAASVTLATNAAATKNSIAQQINTQVGSNIATVVNNAITLTDTVKGAGGTIQILGGTANTTLSLAAQTATGTSASATNVASQINQAVAANATLAAAGIQADGSSGSLVITSSNNTNFRVDAVGGSAAAASITGATGANTAATAAVLTGNATGSFSIVNGENDQLNLKVDGTVYNATIAPLATYTQTTLTAAINTALTNAGSSATVAFVGNQLQITSGAAAGPASSVQVLAGSANTLLGLTTGASATGTAATSGTQELVAAGGGTYNIQSGANDTLNLVLNGVAKTVTLAATASITQANLATEIQNQLGAGFTAAFTGNKLDIKSTATGSSQSVDVLAGSANSLLNLLTGQVTGTNAAASGFAGNANASYAITTGSNDILSITVQGYSSNAAQTVTLTGGGTETQGQAITDINSQLQGAHAFVDTTGHIAIETDATGTSAGISIDGTVSDSAADALGFTSGDVVTGTGQANASVADAQSTGTVAATVGIDQSLTNQLNIKIDGGAAQTINLTTGAAQTLSNVMADINNQLTGGSAFLDASGNLQVKVTATGTTHSVQIVAGSANGTLGVTPAGSATAGVNAAKGIETGSTVGTSFDVEHTTLSVSINGGGAQTINLSGGTESQAQIVKEINNQLAGGTAYVNAGGQLAIASNTTGLTTPTASSVAVGGSAAAQLGFSSTPAVGADAVAGYTIGAGNDNLTVSVDGGNAQSIALANGVGLSASTVAGDIQTKLRALGGAFANVTATATADNTIKLSSGTAGASSQIQIGASTSDAAATLGLTEGVTHSGTMQDVGFGTGGASFTGNAVSAPNDKVANSGGATAVTGLSFTPLANGSDSQAITVSATNANGELQSTTITLQNSGATRTGQTIDAAVQAINTALQKTDNPTLQSVVAVKDDSSGTEKIDFVSSLSAFQVSVGSTGSGTGIKADVNSSYIQSTTVTATSLAGGSTADISTQAGGTAAVAEVTAAVAALGSAQANVGKAQNTLNYAIGLAESQDTNLAAAQSSVRDADMATEAANLTKAQVLQQSAIAAMVQANSAPQNVLTLLRG